MTVRGEMDNEFAEKVPYPYAIFEYFGKKGTPHAFFCRHARNIQLHNVQVEWGQVSGPWMSALRCEEVENLDVYGLQARQGPGNQAAAVTLVNVRGTSLRGCRAADPTGTFLRLNGDRTTNISAVGNDLLLAHQAFDLAGEVPAGAFQQNGNFLP